MLRRLLTSEGHLALGDSLEIKEVDAGLNRGEVHFADHRRGHALLLAHARDRLLRLLLRRARRTCR
jgi:hypothetical protein